MKIYFNHDYVLENEHVILRPLVISDINELMEYALNEPEIWKYNANGAEGKENLTNYIQQAIDQRNMGKEYPFIVFDKRADKYVGSTRFYHFEATANKADLGYTWYGKIAQGTKVNKSCKYLLLEFAFEKVGLDRVGFAADNANRRSITAMKSIGAIEEGVLRNSAVGKDGNKIDVIVLSILKEEWMSSVKTNLLNKIQNP